MPTTETPSTEAPSTQSQTTPENEGSGAASDALQAVARAELLYDLHVAGRLDVFLEMLARGHTAAAAELAPMISEAVANFKKALATLASEYDKDS